MKKTIVFSLLSVFLGFDWTASAYNYEIFPVPTPRPELATRPASPELLSPSPRARMESGRIRLQWAPVSGADYYTVQVSTDPKFRWRVVDEFLPGATEFEFDAEDGRHYSWRVAAHRTGNKPAYSIGEFSDSLFITEGEYRGPGPKPIPTPTPAPEDN